MKSETQHPIADILAEIVKGICTHHPEACEINVVSRDSKLEIFVIPHTADYRLLCGSQGRTIRALCFVAATAGLISGIETELHLEESFRGERETPRGFHQNPMFDEQDLLAKVDRLVIEVFGKSVPMRYLRSNDKVKVWVELDDVELVSAIADVFYPYGFGNGCLVEIRPISKLPPNLTTVAKYEKRKPNTPLPRTESPA